MMLEKTGETLLLVDWSDSCSHYPLDNEVVWNSKKEKAVLQEHAKELLAYAINENSEIYEKIVDKDCFCHKMIQVFQGKETYEETFFVNCVEAFCNREQFIKSLTPERVLIERPTIVSWRMAKDRLIEFLALGIKEIIEDKRHLSIISEDCKDDIYDDLESFVRVSIEKEKLKKQYPIQYFYELLREKINLSQKQDVLKEKIDYIYDEWILERSYDFLTLEEKAEEVNENLEEVNEEFEEVNEEFEEASEELREMLEGAIEDFLYREEKERACEDFLQEWGDKYIINVTPEKEELFLKIEKGERVEEIIQKEYKLYQELLRAYNEVVYGKRKKPKPSIQAAARCVAFFKDFVTMIEETNLANPDGSFNFWGNVEGFEKLFLEYERQQENKK